MYVNEFAPFVNFSNQLNDYFQLFPNFIKTPRDLLKLNTKDREKWNLSHKVYETAGDLLYTIDNKLDGFYNDIEKSIKTPGQTNRIKKNFEEYNKYHHKVKVEVGQLNWVSDDFLLATISLHQKIAEENIFEFSPEDIDALIPAVSKIMGILKGDKELMRAILIVALEPILVYGALIASRENDNKYISAYQGEVLRSVRTLKRYNLLHAVG